MKTTQEKLERLSSYLKKIYKGGYSHSETNALLEFEFLVSANYAKGYISLDQYINSIINFVQLELGIVIPF